MPRPCFSLDAPGAGRVTSFDAIDWDARFAAARAERQRQRDEKARARAEFAEARRHGLAARHATKLARLRTARLLAATDAAARSGTCAEVRAAAETEARAAIEAPAAAEARAAAEAGAAAVGAGVAAIGAGTAAAVRVAVDAVMPAGEATRMADGADVPDATGASAPPNAAPTSISPFSAAPASLPAVPGVAMAVTHVAAEVVRPHRQGDTLRSECSLSEAAVTVPLVAGAGRRRVAGECGSLGASKGCHGVHAVCRPGRVLLDACGSRLAAASKARIVCRIRGWLGGSVCLSAAFRVCPLWTGVRSGAWPGGVVVACVGCRCGCARWRSGGSGRCTPVGRARRRAPPGRGSRRPP